MVKSSNRKSALFVSHTESFCSSGNLAIALGYLSWHLLKASKSTERLRRIWIDITYILTAWQGHDTFCQGYEKQAKNADHILGGGARNLFIFSSENHSYALNRQESMKNINQRVYEDGTSTWHGVGKKSFKVRKVGIILLNNHHSMLIPTTLLQQPKHSPSQGIVGHLGSHTVDQWCLPIPSAPFTLSPLTSIQSGFQPKLHGTYIDSWVTPWAFLWVILEVLSIKAWLSLLELSSWASLFKRVSVIGRQVSAKRTVQHGLHCS